MRVCVFTSELYGGVCVCVCVCVAGEGGMG